MLTHFFMIDGDLVTVASDGGNVVIVNPEGRIQMSPEEAEGLVSLFEVTSAMRAHDDWSEFCDVISELARDCREHRQQRPRPS